MNRLCILLPGKGIDVHLVCYHKCGVKAKTEVTDDLILVCLILILLNEIGRTGKCDLIDVFFHFIRGHTNTIIDELQGLPFRIDNDLNLTLVILG